MEALNKQPSVEDTLNKYFQQLIIDSNSLKDLAQSVKDVNGQQSESFKCSICVSLVFDPQECSTCQNVFCKDCITEWSKKKSTCPLCQAALKLNPLNRILKKLLNEMNVSGCSAQHCEKKSTVMSYEQFINHLNSDCMFVEIICPAKCGKKFQRSQWQSHYQECSDVSVGCSHCKEEIPKALFATHNCIISLRAKVTSQQQEIDMLKEQMEKVLTTLGRIGGGKMFSKSLNGKLFYKLQNKYYCHIHQRELNYVNGSAFSGVRHCDACMRLFQNIAMQRRETQQQSMRYECRLCDFDVCEDCIVKQSTYE